MTEKPVKVVTPTTSRFLTDTEVRKLLLQAEKMGYPSGTMIQMMLLTGIKVNDVIGIHTAEIDRTADVFHMSARHPHRGR